MSRDRISVVGLGKLGAPMLACFASRGFTVVGVDRDAAIVDTLNGGRSPIYEPGLPELLEQVREHYCATTDTRAAVLETDATFVIVPTPSEAEGGFSLRYVLSACEAIGPAIAEKEGFHLVVLTATVMPGSTDGQVRHALEEGSGRRCGHDFGLCYSPEFIALGSVIRNLLNPDFVLIGESDPRSGAELEKIYRRVCPPDVSVRRMSIVNAELTKLALNTYVTTKITFANMLAELCERLPGGDVDAVTGALGLDRRVGRPFLTGAIGYGGPCFPRDNRALASLARSLQVEAPLANITDRANHASIERLAGWVLRELPPGGKVGILGLSYKPNTDVVEESQGLMLADILAKGSIPVTAYDPAAMDQARRVLGDRVRFAPTLADCLAASDLLVLVTPWQEFVDLAPEVMARKGRRRVLLDCWRALDREEIREVVEYHAVGLGPDRPEASPSAFDRR